jgi:hypothetical protein
VLLFLIFVGFFFTLDFMSSLTRSSFMLMAVAEIGDGLLLEVTSEVASSRFLAEP